MNRSFLEISGDDRMHFLQGLLTQDIRRLAAEKIQFAALLSPQGKILHDLFAIDAGERIILDTQAAFAPLLLKRLGMYKLRAKVAIALVEAPPAATLPDPRLPGLPPRDYAQPARLYDAPDLPLLGRDFAPDSLTALDAGYELLHGVSFTKGCYVGQEITARMHYKQIARRGWFLLEREDKAPQLANLRFDDVSGGDGPGSVFVDNLPYRAHAPAWARPKFDAFLKNTSPQP